jgi:hypothetical protein
LGLPVVERWPGRDVVWVMAGDRTRIGLWRPQVGLASARGGVHVHFALHVPDEGVRCRGVQTEGPDGPVRPGSQATARHPHREGQARAHRGYGTHGSGLGGHTLPARHAAEQLFIELHQDPAIGSSPV